MAHEKSCDHSNCTASLTNRSVCQTVSEMDWERGIWYAALYGDIEKVESIIKKSQHYEDAVNLEDNSGYTALHYAARNGHLDICKLLLQNGAHINAQTKSGKATPLQKAAVGGKAAAVELLIKNGASLEIQDDDGQTALHKAAANNHHDVEKILIDACPKLLSIKDKKGNVAITDYAPN